MAILTNPLLTASSTVTVANPLVRVILNKTMQVDITVNHLSAIAATTFLCDVFLGSDGSSARGSNMIPTCVRVIKTWAKVRSAILWRLRFPRRSLTPF